MCYFLPIVVGLGKSRVCLVKNIDVKKLFGSSIKVWRNRQGISQEKLGERADLHRTYISDVERGERNLSLESIARLARALNVSVAALFPAELDNGISNGGGHNGQGRKLVKILLVEDNADDVEMTLLAFKRARFANHVSVVSDGAEALDYLFCQGKYSHRLPADHPQLVLLDLNLPKVSGLEVLRRLKSDKRTRKIPVIVLTVSQKRSDIIESDRLGADTYIVKPVSFQRLSQVTPYLNLDWVLLKPSEKNLQPVSA